jgi:hypothetical protein
MRANLFSCQLSSPPPAAASLEPSTSFSTQSNSLYSAYDIRTVNISFGPVKIVIPSTGGVTPLIANTTAMRGFSQVWGGVSGRSFSDGNQNGSYSFLLSNDFVGRNHWHTQH